MNQQDPAALLKQHFGFDTFRGSQLEIIERVLTLCRSEDISFVDLRPNFWADECLQIELNRLAAKQTVRRPSASRSLSMPTRR